MKFIDFLDSATLHETFVFLAQNQGLSGLDPQKPKKNHENHYFPCIHQNFTIFRRIPGKSAKMQKSLFGGFWWFPGRRMLETLIFLWEY